MKFLYYFLYRDLLKHQVSLTAFIEYADIFFIDAGQA